MPRQQLRESQGYVPDGFDRCSRFDLD